MNIQLCKLPVCLALLYYLQTILGTCSQDVAFLVFRYLESFLSGMGSERGQKGAV